MVSPSVPAAFTALPFNHSLPNTMPSHMSQQGFAQRFKTGPTPMITVAQAPLHRALR